MAMEHAERQKIDDLKAEEKARAEVGRGGSIWYLISTVLVPLVLGVLIVAARPLFPSSIVKHFK